MVQQRLRRATMMPRTINTPGTMPGAALKDVRAYNEKNWNVQGYRQVFSAAGSQSFTPTLQTGGIFLYGISITVGTLTDLADTSVTFTVNNLNYITDVPALQLVPNYTQGFLFFPVSTPLTGGKDTFKFVTTKNNAGAVTLFYNIFYLPGKI